MNTQLRELIAAGPMAHLTTLNADGSAQVSVIWIGLDGNDIVSGHLGRYAKVRNIERDPRVVLSFDAPRDHGVVLNPYAVLQAHATVIPDGGEDGGAWDLLNLLTKVYVAPDATFSAPLGPGFTIRYSVRKVGGVGPWTGTAA